MYKFNYGTNVVDEFDTKMNLPVGLCNLCWFIHQNESEAGDTLIKGYDSWCGYYLGTVVDDPENMTFCHCVMVNTEKVFVELLFESEEEADEYIKKNFSKKTYKKEINWVEVSE